jgi:hypothetical protein
MVNMRNYNRNYLQAFNEILTVGEKVDEGYEFEGIKAIHDFDGYTCWLKYKDLTLTLKFHNNYQFDFESTETLSHFMKKVDVLLAN